MAKKKSKGWITAENAAGEPVGSTVRTPDAYPVGIWTRWFVRFAAKPTGGG